MRRGSLDRGSADGLNREIGKLRMGVDYPQTDRSGVITVVGNLDAGSPVMGHADPVTDNLHAQRLALLDVDLCRSSRQLRPLRTIGRAQNYQVRLWNQPCEIAALRVEADSGSAAAKQEAGITRGRVSQKIDHHFRLKIIRKGRIKHDLLAAAIVIDRGRRGLFAKLQPRGSAGHELVVSVIRPTGFRRCGTE